MNKFKFGDVVHDEVLGKCIVLKMDGDLAVIQSESGFKANVNPDHLVKVQHPDTARLDWLEKQRAAAGVWASSKVSITADGVQVETPTLRQAIDASMHNP